MLALVIGWCVFAACLFLPAIPLPVMFGAFVAVIAALLALLLLLRCPGCRARIPQVGFAEWWLPEDAPKPARCPRCGFDLSAPAR